jgi:16S rRNA (guanine527-N7)-methyltransferase
VSVLRERGVDEFVDLGSGGGYPGLPLAVALPTSRALLVESIGKKARFLATATEAVGLAGAVDVFSGRAEALAADRGHRERWQAVTARAVAALADLVELSFPLLRSGGLLVAWKRGDIRDEVAAGRRAAAALGGGTIEVLEPPGGQAGDLLVLATKRGRTASSYPRDPAVRRRVRW